MANFPFRDKNASKSLGEISSDKVGLQKGFLFYVLYTLFSLFCELGIVKLLSKYVKLVYRSL